MEMTVSEFLSHRYCIRHRRGRCWLKLLFFFSFIFSATRNFFYDSHIFIPFYKKIQNYELIVTVCFFFRTPNFRVSSIYFTTINTVISARRGRGCMISDKLIGRLSVGQKCISLFYII